MPKQKPNKRFKKVKHFVFGNSKLIHEQTKVQAKHQNEINDEFNKYCKSFFDKDGEPRCDLTLNMKKQADNVELCEISSDFWLTKNKKTDGFAKVVPLEAKCKQLRKLLNLCKPRDHSNIIIYKRSAGAVNKVLAMRLPNVISQEQSLLCWPSIHLLRGKKGYSAGCSGIPLPNLQDMVGNSSEKKIMAGRGLKNATIKTITPANKKNASGCHKIKYLNADGRAHEVSYSRWLDFNNLDVNNLDVEVKKIPLLSKHVSSAKDLLAMLTDVYYTHLPRYMRSRGWSDEAIALVVHKLDLKFKTIV